MPLVNILFLAAGVLAIIYGFVILWTIAASARDVKQADWLRSEEVTRSRFNSMKNMRHLLEPERQNIRSSRSRARGYAMVVVGIVLIVFGLT
ncbi:MAG TPA: hypothetical protein VNI53_10000 [Gammaproteobacteria bacterium]|nr:hypothetical protein [Gammaproteobacteria bacterium]